MPPGRFGRALPTVTLIVDGEDVPAALGEPIAVSLYAANRLVLGRSVKYHRPRGAACFTGRCDGCLMRVNGVPSVRTCKVEATPGCVVETQNVLGTAEVDLLAATDWFFPEGMNHHEMFTWARPVNRAMQEIARRVAGIGTLPNEATPPTDVERVKVDVLVIGGGTSGLACARALAAAGIDHLLLEEEATKLEGVNARTRCVAIGVYDETDGRRVVLASSHDRLVAIEPTTVVIAQGRAEIPEAFEGNDKPGVLSMHAAERLLACKVLPGKKPLIAAVSERGDALEARLGEHGAKPMRIARDDIRAAKGRNTVTRVETKGGARVACDVLIVEGRTSACFELGVQAGAEVHWDGEGFSLAADEEGATAHPAVFAIGSVCGVTSEDDARAQAERAAAKIVEARRG